MSPVKGAKSAQAHCVAAETAGATPPGQAGSPMRGNEEYGLYMAATHECAHKGKLQLAAITLCADCDSMVLTGNATDAYNALANAEEDGDNPALLYYKDRIKRARLDIGRAWFGR